MNKKRHWKLISTKKAFFNKWVDISEVIYQKPNGQLIDYFIKQGSDIVSILGITKKGTLVCVKQFRPAVNSVTIDLPGGAVDLGEKPEQSAYREFYEETGLKIKKLKKVVSIYHDSGSSKQIKHFFIGEVNIPKNLNQEELHDDCSLVEIEPKDIFKNITPDSILEPSLIIGVFLLFNN